MATCPRCNGEGHLTALVKRGGEECSMESLACPMCAGHGMVSGATALTIAKGRQLRAERIERGESLGEMAKRTGISVVELSRQERGLPA